MGVPGEGSKSSNQIKPEGAGDPLDLTAARVAELAAEGVRLIDVRTSHEHVAGRLAGSDRIGLEELTERRDEIGPREKVVFYCRNGSRSHMAAEAFAGAGYDAHNLEGGIVGWLEEGRPVMPEDGYAAEPGEAAAALEAQARNNA